MLKLPTAVLAALALAAAAAPSALAAQAPSRVTFLLPGAEKAIKGEPPGSAVSALSMRADGGADIVGLAPGRKVVLARITRAGALDPSFGTKGFATPALPSGLNPGQLLRQADGKLILVAGGPAGSKYQLPDYELARFNTDGSLDTSFGSGGLVRLNGIQTGCVDCHAAELTATGQIVLAAATGSIDPAIEHDPNAPQNFRFAVARLNSDGSLDPTFGDKGVATLPGFGYAEGLAVGAGATITAFGVTGQSAPPPTPVRWSSSRRSKLVRTTFDGAAAAPLPFKAPAPRRAQARRLAAHPRPERRRDRVARYPRARRGHVFRLGRLVTLPGSVGTSARLLIDGHGTLMVGSSLGTRGQESPSCAWRQQAARSCHGQRDRPGQHRRPVRRRRPQRSAARGRSCRTALQPRVGTRISRARRLVARARQHHVTAYAAGHRHVHRPARAVADADVRLDSSFGGSQQAEDGSARSSTPSA